MLAGFLTLAVDMLQVPTTYRKDSGTRASVDSVVQFLLSLYSFRSLIVAQSSLGDHLFVLQLSSSPSRCDFGGKR